MIGRLCPKGRLREKDFVKKKNRTGGNVYESVSFRLHESVL